MIWLYSLIRIVQLVLLVRFLLHAFRADEKNRFAQSFSHKVDFVVSPVKRILVPSKLDIDFSPVVVFLVLEVVKQLYFTQYF